MARAALLGARGNSGVILSQLIRGAAEELVSRPGELIDAMLIGAALANARRPRLLLGARSGRGHDPDGRPRDGPPDRRPTSPTAPRTRAWARRPSRATQDPTIAAALERAVDGRTGIGQARPRAAGGAARRRRRRRRRLRADDHVRRRRGGPARRGAAAARAPRARRASAHPEHSSSTYRFCTNFAVTGSGLEPGRFIGPLERLGDSVLVVGDATTLKVHVHTDEPERATALFAEAGEVSRLDVADMRLQVAERDGAGARRRRRAQRRRLDAAATALGATVGSGSRPRPSACAAGRSPSSAATGCASCSTSSACTRSTAGRR